MKPLRRYKDTLVGKGSLLEAALSKDDNGKEAKKVYTETKLAYEKLYPEADRIWFAEKSNSSIVVKPEEMKEKNHG